MTDIDKIGYEVLSKTSIKEDQRFGSVLAIIMIIGIIVNVIRVIQECEKEKMVSIDECHQSGFLRDVIKNLAKRKSWYTSMKLKKIIRQSLPIADYRAYKSEIHDAILLVGTQVSESQVTTLMETVNND